MFSKHIPPSGEHPPDETHPVDRIAVVAAAAPDVKPAMRYLNPRDADLTALSPYLHLLIAQTPNKPSWRLVPGDRLEWRAAVGVAPDGSPAAFAFTSLLKAVQFMQAAVLAGAIQGVNKVGKFPAAAAREWPFALLINPTFEDWRQVTPADSGLCWEVVDWQAAVRGEE